MVKLLLTPPRERLRAAIAARFAAMLEAGAVEEVARFLALPGARAGTAGRAIGVPELAAYLEGRSSLAAAAEQAVTRSRQYAKRQDTWFRHQFDGSWLRQVDLFPSDRDKFTELVKMR